MDTYFSCVERLGFDEISRDVKSICHNQVVDTLLNFTCGIFVVLNDKRQLVMANDVFLEYLGVSNIKDIIGFRLGEVVGCDYAHAHPNGCGTTKQCLSCGAAIAMSYCLREQKSSERVCVVKRDNIEEKEDLVFKVKASPLVIQGKKLVLFFL